MSRAPATLRVGCLNGHMVSAMSALCSCTISSWKPDRPLTVYLRELHGDDIVGVDLLVSH
jgi:hypothetical protein